jgi:hypothetical protein
MKYLCQDCNFRTTLYFHIKNHFQTKKHNQISNITGEELDKYRDMYKQLMVNY